MGLQVNFSAHAKELQDAYQAVLSDTNPTNWLVYSYEKGTNDLKVQDTGDGGLEELFDEFSDGKIQYAFARVIDPNTQLQKYVFIGWCGTGVPESRKAFFNSHLNDVSKFFKSFHVQIQARDEADVEPELIMKRVAESSGAKYSVHKEQQRAMPRVVPVGSVYKKTEIPDIASMQKEAMKKESMPAPVGTNYRPVQTAPKPLNQRWGAGSTGLSDGAAKVRAEREQAEQEARERETAMQKERDAQARQASVEQERRAKEQEQLEQQRLAEDQRQREQQQQEEERRRAQEQQDARHRQEEDQRRAEEEQQAERQRQEAQRRQEEAERQRQQEEEAERQQQEAERQQLEAERQQQEAERQHQEAERQREEERLAAQHQAAATVPTSNVQGQSAVVLFGYDAGEANELSLAEGQVVINIEQVDEGWWFGTTEDGQQQGLFPANYVQLIEASEAPAVVPEPPAAVVHDQPETTQDLGQTAVALYDYDAGEENEISFREHDTITHIEFASDDWWQGVGPDGKSVGLFPANYVELHQ